ncbi:transcription factor pcc1 domain-containing protein [Purpureocillium lilacinum]|uniref:Transcription factor pcc1 domain-containing protein n=1 Tax=Purpureocillium lilacinum TaxID=33203 RepID=A0A179H1C3_PURLI|nr:transcription factor pcc1 domain-containing protein [Purpureocillium lilacinum]
MATTTTTAALPASAGGDAAFPCSIALRVPLPSARLASTALRALEVDPELSPLVRRQLSVEAAAPAAAAADADADADAALKVLHVDYQATTNRMLRVAVNSFLDSLKLVLEVMEQLDVDVLAEQHQRQLRQGPPT